MLGDAQPDLAFCAPHTAAHFSIEQRLETNGICADIRRFGWTGQSRATFEADAYYLDFSIGPRSASSRFFKSDRQLAEPPGNIVFLPKGSAFRALSQPGEHQLLCLTFGNERAMRLFEDDTPSSLPPCFDVQIDRVRYGLARLVEELRNPGFGQDILLESIALSMVVDLCRHLRNSGERDGSRIGKMPDWRLRRIKDRIESELATPLSTVDLAAEIRTSPRHLIRTFKSTTGMTLSDYIARRRIERAMHQLAQDDTLIKVIAGNCGFQSAAAFSASFRKATGMTPKEYRQTQLSHL